MEDLERVEAELFERAFSTGRNRPILVSARTQAGELVPCVIKLAARMESPEMHPLACSCEWVAAAVAGYVGIKVPRPYEVVVSREFADSVSDREIRQQALASIGSTFGSAYLDEPGDRASTYTQNIKPLAAELRTAAADLLAFDVFIHNPDRRPTNPNLFLRRTDLVAFDHGDAFSFLFAIGGDAVSDPLLEMVALHVFGADLKRRSPDFASFRTGLATLADSAISDIQAKCPAAWTAGLARGKLATICGVLKGRRDAVDVWLPQVEAWLVS